MRTGWGRRAFVAVAALSLVMSCSPGADVDDGPSEVGTDATVRSFDPAAPQTTARPGDPTPAPTVGSSPNGNRPTGGGDGGPAGTTSPEDPIVQGSRSGPGKFAPVLLQARPATQLTIDVMAQAGAEPRDAPLQRIKSVLAQVSGKPVNLIGPSAILGGGKSWTAAQLRQLADEEARSRQGGSEAAIRVLFLRGQYQGDDSILGVTIRGDTFVIFSDSVQGASSPVVSEAVIEDAVTMHELGHVLGLVGLVVNAERQDDQHPGHSTNEESVMYWAVESSLIGQVLGGSPPRDFDSEDLADLATIRRG